MKEKVIAIIASDLPEFQKFNELFAIYRDLQGNNFALVRHFNVFGYKKSTYEDLMYQLKRLLNITDYDVAVFESKPKEKIIPLDPFTETDQNEESDSEKELDDLTDADEADAEIKELNPEKNQSFREEYSFLNDPNCPEEFKILAADKITAFRKLQSLHESIKAEDLSDEDRAVIATELKEADELNDLIKNEFAHFAEKGEPLGIHPIFSERMLQKKIDQMTGEEKAKRLSNLKTYVRRYKTKLEKAMAEKDQAKVDNFTKKLQDYETEEKLIVKSMS